MQMMYEIIAKEIKAAQLENAHPTDYLNFYCLGNREECPEEESNGSGLSSSNGTTVSVPHSDAFCNHKLFFVLTLFLLALIKSIKIAAGFFFSLFKQHQFEIELLTGLKEIWTIYDICTCERNDSGR